MILLFGEKAHKTSKNSNIKNHPVESSGILAMNKNNVKSLFDTNEYDSCDFSFQTSVDYSMFGTETGTDVAFLSSFSSAVSTLGDCGFASSFSGGDCSCSCSCGGFSSVC